MSVPCGPLNKEHELQYQLGVLQARVIVAADVLLPVVEQVRAQTALQHVFVVRYAELLPGVRRASTCPPSCWSCATPWHPHRLTARTSWQPCADGQPAPVEYPWTTWRS